MTREEMIDAAIRQATSSDLRPMYALFGYVPYSRRVKIIKHFTRIVAREANQ